ncbi:hypothetical protein [Polyangium sp. 6x1]|uniref:hypothetical protein n=1 Tax=Polyangium sp. 6x1 TaxID=3042689 RepID=UPI002483159D|nr:hypothetical protein [Polyangium sp. 6x1]MDI1448504.1 hypothetical protein [Polyangium sp. 6x1]
MKTILTSKPNHYLAAVLSLLALATPGCVVDADEDGALGAADDIRDLVEPAERKPVPVRPPLAPNVITDAELPEKPEHDKKSNPASSLSGWTVNLTATPDTLWPTEWSKLRATTNNQLGPTPYYLAIYDNSTGARLAACGYDTFCEFWVSKPNVSWGSYTAYVQRYDATDTQAESPYKLVEWHGANLDISATQNTVGIGASTTITATASWDVGPSPFYILIFDVTTGTLLEHCGIGSSCGVTVSEGAATTHAYQAFLAPYGASLPLAGVQEATAKTYVTWSDSGYSLSLGTPVLQGSAETVTVTSNINVVKTPYWIQLFSDWGTRLGSCKSGATCTLTYPAAGTYRNLFAFISADDANLLPADIQASSNKVRSPLYIP